MRFFSLFKMKADELDLTTAIQVAIQMEDAAKVAKETVYGPKPVQALAIAQKPSRQQPVHQRPPKKEVSVGQQRCYRCGNSGHITTSCKFKDAKCNFCKFTGHLEAVCRKKVRSKLKLKASNGSMSWEWLKQRCVSTLKSKLQVPIHING